MIYQGLSDTLLGHPGRGGSPAACPELTRPTQKATKLQRLKGVFFLGGERESIEFMKLFKKNPNSKYQLIGLYLLISHNYFDIIIKGSLAQKLPIYERHLSKVKSIRVVSSRVESSWVESSRVKSSRVESLESSWVESSPVE